MDQTEFLNLSEAARAMPGSPSPSTVWRWCRKGVLARNGERIRLRHVRAGSRIFVPPSAIDQFMTAVADADVSYLADDEHVPAAKDPSPNLRLREKQVATAENRLRARGLL